MKTIAALMLTMISVTAYCSQDKPVEQKVAKWYTWNEMTHDFGKINQNDPPVYIYGEKQRSGPSDHNCSRTSCGCTVAEYTKEPIKPVNRAL